MEQINFRDWRLVASIADADILRLEVEALDGTDIAEIGGPSAEREGEEYALHLTTQKLEEAQRQRPRRLETHRGADRDEDDTSAAWLADEDETLYLRGWEVDALVDEDGMLTVTVTRGEGAEIYEVEPLESGVALSPRIVVRLAAEETGDDEDEDEEEDEEDEEEMADDFEDLDQFDELDDDYGDNFEEEDDLGDNELFPEDEETY